MNRVHIVGLSPRTGTTLMMELMAHCFNFEAYANHEMSIFRVPDKPVSTFCSKSPKDIVNIKHVLNDPNLWFICMIRDPRDVVVSKHASDPEKYWVNLDFFQERFQALNSLLASDRFIPIKYEELVENPNSIQQQLIEAIPFLQKTADFSDFHKIATPTEKAVTALNGVRKISTTRVGNWKSHLPRIKAQLDIFGSISRMLIELGYETDDQWEKQLEATKPDNGESHFPVDGFTLRKKFKRTKKHLKNLFLFKMGMPIKEEVIFKKENRHVAE